MVTPSAERVLMPSDAPVPSEAVDVVVNDAPRSLPAGTTLQTLLDGMVLSSRPGVAVAVNASVVGRIDWATCRLKQGDRILVIHASQGG